MVIEAKVHVTRRKKRDRVKGREGGRGRSEGRRVDCSPLLLH